MNLVFRWLHWDWMWNISDAEVKKLEESGKKEADFLANAIHFVNKRGFEAYCAVIDCMAVAYAIDPTLVETMEAHVGVETNDRHRQKTSLCMGAPSVGESGMQSGLREIFAAFVRTGVEVEADMM